MRAAAIVILGALVGASACGAARADDGGLSVRTAYAPADADAPASGPVGDVDAALPEAKDDSGNPLWAVPLSALTETRDRPLFSPSRRPPPSAPAEAPPPPPEAPPPVAALEPDKPPWTLIGTIVSPAASLAIIETGNQAVSRLRVGEEDSGWRVRSVAARSVVVQKGGTTVTLGLPRISGADAPSQQ